MSDSAKPSLPNSASSGGADSEEGPPTLRDGAPRSAGAFESRVVWPRDMSAPETGTPAWGCDPKVNDHE